MSLSVLCDPNEVACPLPACDPGRLYWNDIAMQKSNAMHTARKIVGDAIKLASLPDIYWRVKRVIDKPDSSAQQLANVISTDPAMSAGLLRLVNSAFWGFGGQVVSLSRAAVLLGSTRIHDVLLSVSLGQTFKGVAPDRMDVGRFWRGSVYRALAAASLARKTELPDPESMFVTGLLSDIGHMVLYQKLPDLTAHALEVSGGRFDELPQTEREVIGCDYAQVGAALMDVWGLPTRIRIPIEFQVDPSATEEYALETALLHLAGRLAAHQAHNDAGPDPLAGLATISEPFWKLVGLNELYISEVIEKTVIDLPALTELFVSGLKVEKSRTPVHA